MKILLVDGTIIGQKTSAILEQTRLYLLEASPEVEVTILKLADYQHQFVDGRPLGEYNEDMQHIAREFEEADGYIIASPIFQGSIPGVLKNVFDLLHPRTMRYKAVSIVANGGTYQHHLVIENQLKPILDYFRCFVTPNYVYTHTSHFDEQNRITEEDVHDRLRELARVFVKYMEMGCTLSKETLDTH
ncbi:NADPH-dependent FMN reductase [Paenisporosarcina cavernae]|uniref:NADH-dependent FMN reductase n=1 Tax=Paenisporosarcina cavernae TaxID=2320858 RepID=A0A385YTE7_9BACL|nr:NADPH-dependent FMN reductase [Paenisporosarcina cavernae]AYC28753.1 NADH-dependent FMN reductase [Paenisporosarcina cavernae]